MKPGNVDQEIYDLLDRSRPVKQWKAKKRKVVLGAQIAVLVAAAARFLYWYACLPRGRFTLPAPGATVDRVIELEGFTRNIPPERRFVWVVVDVPDLGLCWPHRHIPKINEPFRVKISELGPNRTFIVSLSAVPWVVH